MERQTERETRTPREIDKDTRDRAQRETETPREPKIIEGGNTPETGSWRIGLETEKGHRTIETIMYR